MTVETYAEPLPIIKKMSVFKRLAAAFAPHEQEIPDMTIQLDAGHILCNDSLTEVAAQSTAILTAPASYPRIDRVVIDKLSGAAEVVTGTEAAAPEAPAIPPGKYPIAQVILKPTSLAVTNNMISDERSFYDASGVDLISVTEENAAAYTYDASDNGNLVRRSNGGAAMADTLPGTGTGVMAAGWSVSIANSDESALLSIEVGSGAVLNDAPLGYLVLGPRQQARIVSDGTNYNILSAPERIKLGADTTLYVATTGNDEATGLTDSLPFASIQHAVNIAQDHYDLGAYDLTIKLADGTYTSGVSLTGPFSGKGAVAIVGNETTPTNVIVSTVSANAFEISDRARLTLKGFMVTTTTGGFCLLVYRRAYLVLGNLVFGACAATHIYTYCDATVTCISGYQVTGSAQRHIFIGANSTYMISYQTITVSGTPSFSNYFIAADAGLGYFYGSTISGSATGTRYRLQNNGSLITGGGGATYFPGSVSGTNDGTGTYS